jgi:GNAT superfamily N-acetyltransferase
VEIVEVERDTIAEFLNREWQPEDERRFGRHDPTMWDVQQHALAAYEGERIVGAAVFKIEAGLGKLSQIITAADHRGHGIGKALSARVEDICRREGCHKISLKTYWNSEAQRFYKRQGYVVEGVLRRDLHGADMCLMRKFL